MCSLCVSMPQGGEEACVRCTSIFGRPTPGLHADALQGLRVPRVSACGTCLPDGRFVVRCTCQRELARGDESSAYTRCRR